MSKRITHILIFMIGLLVATTGLHRLDDMPFWGMLNKKVTHLRDHLAQYDTIFLGSSRVHNGFIPSVYDARMAALGDPTTTLNLGQSGLRQHDYDAVIDWMIANRPPKLRRLMIELHAWVQGPRNDNWMTAHEIEIHPIRHLPARLTSIAIDNNDWSTKLEHAVHATLHSVTNYLRVGQGPRIVDALVQAPPQVRDLPDEGWEELSPATMTNKRRLEQHNKWVADPGPALRTLETKRQDLEPESRRGGFNVSALRSQIARLRAEGIEPVYVVMPHYAFNFYGRDGLAAVRDEVTILEFDVVSENEDLHEFPLWFDWAHMMKPGAERFSNKLAERIHALPKN